MPPGLAEIFSGDRQDAGHTLEARAGTFSSKDTGHYIFDDGSPYGNDDLFERDLSGTWSAQYDDQGTHLNLDATGEEVINGQHLPFDFDNRIWGASVLSPFTTGNSQFISSTSATQNTGWPGTVRVGEPPYVHYVPVPAAPPEPTAMPMLPICFAAGTLVVMADGSTKLIEQIQAGEWVLAADEHDPQGPIRPARVVETYHTTPKPLLAVSVAGPTLRCTFRHPFYVKDEGWTAAEELAPGDLLRTSGDE